MNDNQPTHSSFTNILVTIALGIWSIVGIVILILVSIAVFRSGTWVENLNISSEPEVAQQTPTEQPQQQPPQPPQPSQEQLTCVSEEVGEERFIELQQGATATDEEAATIQQCFQG